MTYEEIVAVVGRERYDAPGTSGFSRACSEVPSRSLVRSTSRRLGASFDSCNLHRLARTSTPCERSSP